MLRTSELAVRVVQRLGWAATRMAYRRHLLPPETVPTDVRLGNRSAPEKAGDLELIASFEGGQARALYSSRYAALPFRLILAAIGYEPTDILWQGLVDTKSQPRTMAYDGVRYSHPIIDKLICAFKEAETTATPIRALQILREEVFHHHHLRGTRSWTLVNGLTFYYRLSAAWLSFRRLRQPVPIEADGARKTVAMFHLNTYLVRRTLRTRLVPVMEAFAHLHESKQRLRATYGHPAILEAWDALKSIEDALEGRPGNPVAIVARWAVDFPFGLYARTSHTLSYHTFAKFLQTRRDADPVVRLGRVRDSLRESNDRWDEIRQALDRDRDEFPIALVPGVLWLMSRPWVPSELFLGVLWQLVSTSYGTTILFNAALSAARGRWSLDKFYTEMPAIWTYTPTGETIIFDPGLRSFSDRSYSAAMRGLEAGFRGYTVENTRVLWLDAMLLNSIAADFLDQPRDLAMVRNFVFDWRPDLHNAAEAIRKWFAILDEAGAAVAEGMRMLQSQGEDPVGFQTAVLYERALLRLRTVLYSYEESKRALVYSFAGSLYAHGF